MAQIKVASWNVYFSHKLVSGSSGNYRIAAAEADRVDNVAAIIQTIDP